MAGESIEQNDVRGDGGKSPGKKAEAVDGEWHARRAESAIPPDDAEDDFGGDFSSDGDSELLNDGSAGRRKMSGEVADAGLRRTG